MHFSLRRTGSFNSDQGEIWEEIDRKFTRCQETPSPTMALSDLCDAKKDTTEDYLKKFSPVDNQTGLAVFIDGNIAGVEFLGRHDKFQILFQKLVSSYVMDALENDVEAPKEQTSRSFNTLIGFLANAAQSPIDRRKSVALGWDIRLEAESIVGAGLEFEEQILQLSLFHKGIGQRNGHDERPLRRASGRRRNLVR